MSAIDRPERGAIERALATRAFARRIMRRYVPEWATGPAPDVGAPSEKEQANISEKGGQGVMDAGLQDRLPAPPTPSVEPSSPPQGESLAGREASRPEPARLPFSVAQVRAALQRSRSERQRPTPREQAAASDRSAPTQPPSPSDLRPAVPEESRQGPEIGPGVGAAGPGAAPRSRSELVELGLRHEPQAPSLEKGDRETDRRPSPPTPVAASDASGEARTAPERPVTEAESRAEAAAVQDSVVERERREEMSTQAAQSEGPADMAAPLEPAAKLISETHEPHQPETVEEPQTALAAAESEDQTVVEPPKIREKTESIRRVPADEPVEPQREAASRPPGEAPPMQAEALEERQPSAQEQAPPEEPADEPKPSEDVAPASVAPTRPQATEVTPDLAGREQSSVPVGEPERAPAPLDQALSVEPTAASERQRGEMQGPAAGEEARSGDAQPTERLSWSPPDEESRIVQREVQRAAPAPEAGPQAEAEAIQDGIERSEPRLEQGVTAAEAAPPEAEDIEAEAQPREAAGPKERPATISGMMGPESASSPTETSEEPIRRQAAPAAPRDEGAPEEAAYEAPEEALGTEDRLPLQAIPLQEVLFGHEGVPRSLDRPDRAIIRPAPREPSGDLAEVTLREGGPVMQVNLVQRAAEPAQEAASAAQRSGSSEAASAEGGQTPRPAAELSRVELDRLADAVYRRLRARLRVERERRGPR